MNDATDYTLSFAAKPQAVDTEGMIDVPRCLTSAPMGQNSGN